MDMNLLVINVGNSRAALGSFVAGKLDHSGHVEHGKYESVRAAVAAAWTPLYGKNAEIAACSVNPEADSLVEKAVAEVTGRQVQWVGPDIDLPIDVLTEVPAETGVDRILNVAAAYEQMQKACVVVDAGTAITVDLCNDQGQFMGGAIAAGASMMLDALHERTARLPRASLAAPAGPIGRSTQEALRHGVFHGVRGMVKELVENYAVALGAWPEIIATGGDAQVLFGGWELIHAISPDLTLYGIALAYAEHHIREGT